MITSSVSYKGKLRTICSHQRSGTEIFTDAPIDNQGQGQAFSPTDLLATSLASCMITIMGIRSIESGIVLKNVDAEVEKIMGVSPRRVVKIKISMKIYAELNESQKEDLKNVALNCPVAKSIHPEIIQDINFSFQ